MPLEEKILLLIIYLNSLRKNRLAQSDMICSWQNLVKQVCSDC